MEVEKEFELTKVEAGARQLRLRDKGGIESNLKSAWWRAG